MTTITPTPPEAGDSRAREVLASYGAEPGRWPASERDAIRTWIERDPDIAEALFAERRLDDALALHPDPPAITVNPLSITAAARRNAGDVPASRSRHWVPRAASLVAAAVLGFAVGVSGIGGDRAAVDDGEALALIITFDEDWL